jgi:hypothetical protein
LGFVAAAAVLAMASPAAAHCTFGVDRERTTPGGEFYGLGQNFAPGEIVQIRWMPSNIVLDEFVVTETHRHDDGKGYGNWRRLLHAPTTAEPENWYTVKALIFPPFVPGRDESDARYKMSTNIYVFDPAAPRPETAEPAAPPVPARGGDSHDGSSAPPPPPPPSRVHEPVSAPAPAPAVAPVSVHASVPVHAHVPEEVAEPVAQPAPATEPVHEPARRTREAPVAHQPPVPATARLGEAFAAVAGRIPPIGTIPAAALAMCLAAAGMRRRRIAAPV